MGIGFLLRIRLEITVPRPVQQDEVFRETGEAVHPDILRSGGGQFYRCEPTSIYATPSPTVSLHL